MTKPTQWHVRPAKTQISLGIHPVWSESSLSAWRKLRSLATNWAHSKYWSDWTDAQADLSLRWAHMPFCWFCHDATHLLISGSSAPWIFIRFNSRRAVIDAENSTQKTKQRTWMRKMSPWIQPELTRLCFILAMMAESLRGKTVWFVEYQSLEWTHIEVSLLLSSVYRAIYNKTTKSMN